MTMQTIQIDPDAPRKRQLRAAVEGIREGALVVYPGDSGYAILCSPELPKAVDRMRSVRNLPRTHHITLLCSSLKDLADWVVVETPMFRVIKQLTPGPFTFIFEAGPRVSKKILFGEKKTVGLRFPASPLAEALLDLYGGPLMTTSLTLPPDQQPAEDPEIIQKQIGHAIQFLFTAGERVSEPSTVLDLRQMPPVLLRQGAGDASQLVRE
ncbi:MAG: L-threonylcarbamoyladenylate synthase [Gammaproteobacteria bacterium]